MWKRLLLSVLLSSAACMHVQSPASGSQDLPLNSIRLPEGFQISIYASGVPGARSMALGPKGILFVGTRVGEVYAIVDRNRDQRTDEVITVARGLRMPNGVAFRDGLYVAEVNRVLRYEASRPVSRIPRPLWWSTILFPMTGITGGSSSGLGLIKDSTFRWGLPAMSASGANPMLLSCG